VACNSCIHYTDETTTYMRKFYKDEKRTGATSSCLLFSITFGDKRFPDLVDCGFFRSHEWLETERQKLNDKPLRH